MREDVEKDNVSRDKPHRLGYRHGSVGRMGTVVMTLRAKVLRVSAFKQAFPRLPAAKFVYVDRAPGNQMGKIQRNLIRAPILVIWCTDDK